MLHMIYVLDVQKDNTSFDIMTKIKNSSGKQVKRKNEIPTDRNRLKKERAFLFFLAHNPHHLQNKSSS